MACAARANDSQTLLGIETLRARRIKVLIARANDSQTLLGIET